MKVYTTDRIRNVVLLGHGGSGKTSLVEAMAYLGGITSRLGNVTDGNTISDFDKEEIKRKFSISTSLVPIAWGDVKVNILDAPGYFDFVGEAEEAAAAADAAVIVVNGKNGVEVGTLKAWALCEKYSLPRMIFITNMDFDNASFRKITEDLTEQFGKKIAPIHFPIRENEKFTGYVNVVKKAGRKWLEKGQKEECPIPEYLDEYLEKYRETLLEAVAETSEEFMDRYFAGEEFSVHEIMMALTQNVSSGDIVPVAMGSPVQLRGVANLLDDIVQYLHRLGPLRQLAAEAAHRLPPLPFLRLDGDQAAAHLVADHCPQSHQLLQIREGVQRLEVVEHLCPRPQDRGQLLLPDPQLTPGEVPFSCPKAAHDQDHINTSAISLANTIAARQPNSHT